MKFTEILEELKKGKKVTREKWETAGDACSVDFIVYNQKNDKCEYYLDGRYDNGFVWSYEDITAEDWKIYEEPTKNWEPKEGDTIFYITETGRVISGTFLSILPSDVAKVRFNNAFQTREEAEHMLKKIKIINKLKELSNVDFNEDFDEQKWYITYNHRTKSIECDTTYHVQRMPFCIYFKNQEDCGKAIDTIGEYDLKKYYFDVEEEK